MIKKCLKRKKSSDKRSRERLIVLKRPTGVGVIREPGPGRGFMSLPPTMLPSECVCVCVIELYIYILCLWQKITAE